MNNSELILARITRDDHADHTICAALDALREEGGFSMLDAVLAVGAAYHAGRNARDIAEASAYLAEDSAIKNHLTEVIRNNALNLPDGAYTTISVIEGNAPPLAHDNSLDAITHTVALAAITVGALWVKRVASQIMVEQERAAGKPKRRRSK